VAGALPLPLEYSVQTKVLVGFESPGIEIYEDSGLVSQMVGDLSVFGQRQHGVSAAVLPCSGQHTVEAQITKLFMNGKSRHVGRQADST
jgi:hypothetical protein